MNTSNFNRPIFVGLTSRSWDSLVLSCALCGWLLLSGCDSRVAVTSTAPSPTDSGSVTTAVEGQLIRPEPTRQDPTDGAATNFPKLSGVTSPEIANKPTPTPVVEAPKILAPPAALIATPSVAPVVASVVSTVTNVVAKAAFLPAASVATLSVAPVVAAAVSKVPASTAAARSESDAVEILGFDKLSAFSFEVSDEILQAGTSNAVTVAARTAEQIPKPVRDFDSKRIALKGFMLPLKVEAGKVTEMLIMRDQSMCCYGSVPKINEWVSVRMVGEGVKPIMDQAVTLYGRLHVGEMRENGYLVGIYRMDGERLEGPTEN